MDVVVPVKERVRRDGRVGEQVRGCKEDPLASHFGDLEKSGKGGAEK